jgi:RHS repeat-associated protein
MMKRSLIGGFLFLTLVLCTNALANRFDAETGLMYYKNRYHSTALGRFISRDPIGYRGGINLYEYVDSAPTYWLDPMGLMTYWECHADCMKKKRPMYTQARQYEACREECKSKYPSFDASIKGPYNCAGVALRSYEDMNSVEIVKLHLSKENGGRKLTDCKDSCECGEVKCWLWEWDYVLITAEGYVVSVKGVPQIGRAFHIQCAPVGEGGKVPPTTEDKQGVAGKVEQRPTGVLSYSDRDRQTQIKDREVYSIMSNLKTTCYCIKPKCLPISEK